METIEIGGTPYEEDCAATGKTEDAQTYNRLECRAFIAALRQVYGKEPEGSELKLRGNPHEFGTYYEVVYRCEWRDDAHREHAAKLERGLKTWEEAGFWKPVTYDDQNQPIHTIYDPKAWRRETNPQALPKLP